MDDGAGALVSDQVAEYVERLLAVARQEARQTPREAEAVHVLHAAHLVASVSKRRARRRGGERVAPRAHVRGHLVLVLLVHLHLHRGASSRCSRRGGRGGGGGGRRHAEGRGKAVVWHAGEGGEHEALELLEWQRRLHRESHQLRRVEALVELVQRLL